MIEFGPMRAFRGFLSDKISLFYEKVASLDRFYTNQRSRYARKMRKHKKFSRTCGMQFRAPATLVWLLCRLCFGCAHLQRSEKRVYVDRTNLSRLPRKSLKFARQPGASRLGLGIQLETWECSELPGAIQ